MAQQEVFRWPVERPPALLFMDSYAELTDQLFVHRRGKWFFSSNYTDLHHDADFERDFECRGLLPLEGLEARYREFFTAFKTEIGNLPIVFIHFPKDLERREKFRTRHEAISAVAMENPMLHSIEVDEGIVDWSDNPQDRQDAFPYHYNQQTYTNLAGKVRALGLEI